MTTETETSKFIARSVSVGDGTKIVKPRLFSSKPTKHSTPLLPDTEALCAQIAATYTELDVKGYDVVQLMPINVGVQAEVNDADALVSVTRGAIVVGRRRDLPDLDND